ncbi:MAG: endonuclease/exonuclease/phosphatase family protein [Lacisediminihabitans sp.]
MFRRILAAVLLVAVAAALLVFVWPQLFGLQRTAVIAQAVSLRAPSAAAALVGVIALTLLALLNRTFRRFGASLALLLLVFSLVTGAVLATRGFGDTSFQTKSPSDVTVLSWNTLGDAPGPAAIAKLALSSGADIVTLPETTEATAITVALLMKAGGHPMWVHTVAFDQVSKSKSTSLLTSAALGRYHVGTGTGTGPTSTLPTIIAKPDNGTGPTIVAVHAVAPLPSELKNWRSDLVGLSTVCTGRNVILAGDFNSTIDHMAGLGSSPGTALGSCRDAAVQTRNAAVGTWPTFAPALLGAPIDHVMVTADWRVTGMRVIENLDKAGSDHRPIVVQLARSGN